MIDRITKDRNGEYGEKFCLKIVEAINTKKIVKDDFFNYIDNIYKNFFNKYIKAEYVGNKVSNEDCDIIAYKNDTEYDKIEIKFVYDEKSSGTYFNTTLNYFGFIGFEPYKNFLIDNNYYDYLLSLGLFPDKINNSPFTLEESKRIRKNITLYNKVVEFEKDIRKKYVEYIYKSLLEDKEKLCIFSSDMITKKESGKKMADFIFTFNYKNNTYKVLTKKEIFDKIENTKNFISKSSLSIKFLGYRIQFGWQNGNGLNNPTLRVFLT